MLRARKITLKDWVIKSTGVLVRDQVNNWTIRKQNSWRSLPQAARTKSHLKICSNKRPQFKTKFSPQRPLQPTFLSLVTSPNRLEPYPHTIFIQTTHRVTQQYRGTNESPIKPTKQLQVVWGRIRSHQLIPQCQLARSNQRKENQRRKFHQRCLWYQCPKTLPILLIM